MRECYSPVARAWSWVFALFGLTFLAAPEWAGGRLTTLAGILGLPGRIVAPGGTLWWVLALSLMSCVTVLAAASARRPADHGAYVALMTAKLSSTLLFVMLAISHGWAWLLCAAGDGFVALTLWLARRTLPAPWMPPGFARTWGGAGPHHEEHFAMVDAGNGRALWLSYMLCDGVAREASVRGVFFDGAAVRVGRRVWDLEDLAPGNAPVLPAGPNAARFRGWPQVFLVEDARLDARHALGSVDSLTWDLSFDGGTAGASHAPWPLRALGLVPQSYCACYLDARVRGRLSVGAETIELDGARAMLGHIEGARMAESWTWVHCNRFGESGVVFEAISARLRLAGRAWGPLTSLVLLAAGREYRFSPLACAFGLESRIEGGRWTFCLESRGVTLRGEARLALAAAELEYEDTDGSRRRCRNSPLSDLELWLRDPELDGERRFSAPGSASVEFVESRPARQ
jgi:hypothetical protein